MCVCVCVCVHIYLPISSNNKFSHNVYRPGFKNTLILFSATNLPGFKLLQCVSYI